MEQDPLTRVGRKYHTRKAQLDKTRDELRDLIVEEARNGAPTMDLARRSGYDREVVRRIIKQAKEDGRLPADEEDQ